VVTGRAIDDQHEQGSLRDVRATRRVTSRLG
jgi:hypothetical protein